MPIRALIVEDEQHSRERLARMLAVFEDVEVVGAAVDGRSAVSAIDGLRPEVVFLDVQLPELSGFEVLQRTAHRPVVVFVTAFDEYAVKAFDENAVDYLLKPISEERLARAVQRIRSERRPLDETVRTLLQDALRRERFPEHLAVRQRDTILLVPVNAILWMSAEDRYIVLHTPEHEYLYDGSLKDLEARLDPARFLRIHRGTIVAQDKIDRIVCAFGGRYLVRMAGSGAPSLPVGRAYLAQLRGRLRF